MKNAATILRYIVIALVVVIVAGLLGWYYFLRSAEVRTSATDTARGLGTQVPSFGSSIGSTYQNIASTITGGETASAGATPGRLWEVSAAPVAGADFTDSSTSTLLFAARSTGYIFSADAQSGDITRLTDTLSPKIYQAFFAPGGFVIERSLDGQGNTTTFAGTIATTTSTSADSTSSPDTLTGTYMAPNIPEISVNAASHMILYEAASPSAGATGITSNWGGTTQKRVFVSPLQDWHLWWLADNRIIVAQKAADDVPGFAYQVLKDGTFSPLLSGIPGLTVLPHASSTALIFGESSGGTLSLFAQVGSSTAVSLPIQTVADKCVWAPGKTLIAYCAVPEHISSSNFLDDWYRGAAHTTDEWWRIDAQAGTAEKIFSAQDAGYKPLDAEYPVIDTSGSYIAFENAADQSLWVLRIQQ